MKKKTTLLTQEQDLLRIQELLKQYPITEWEGSQDTFLLFGYKNISLGSKETYQILRNLALNQYKLNKENGYICKVSLDFLASSLDTTQLTQIRRTKELEEVNLISIIKNNGSTNTYRVQVRPYPDSTFEYTIKRLILRRDCLDIIYKAKTFETLRNQIDAWKQLSIFYKSPYCRKLITDRFSSFYPINLN